MASSDPRIDTIDAWVSAGIRQVVPMAELSKAFSDTYQKVAALVGAAGGQLVGPAYGCYFGMPSDVVDLEIGFGIDRAIESADLTVTEQPEVQAVVATHVGPYEDLSATYEKLMPWLEQQDLDLADHMWELYDSGPETRPEETVTRIVFPQRGPA